jgi:hypothetical protein
LIDAACFGRTPPDYHTALIGVALANDDSGAKLVNAHRSLGAPLIIEVGDTDIGIWSVGRELGHTQRQQSLDIFHFPAWVESHAAELAPREFLKTKNLKDGPIFIQGSLFAGLIPELEEHIAETLEPLLTSAFRAGVREYKKITGSVPQESRLFKVAFSMLAGKVFTDRRHKDFDDLGPDSSADEVLERVAVHYNDAGTPALLNRATREVVFDRI